MTERVVCLGEARRRRVVNGRGGGGIPDGQGMCNIHKIPVRGHTVPGGEKPTGMAVPTAIAPTIAPITSISTK